MFVVYEQVADFLLQALPRMPGKVHFDNTTLQEAQLEFAAAIIKSSGNTLHYNLVGNDK